MKRTRRTAGLVGLAHRQLASDRARTLFAIAGVAFAVLSVTLLFGVGAGVVQTGETLLDNADADLWVSGGPVEFQPGSVGGFQNPVVDAHATADEMQTHDDVRLAIPFGLQTAYVSADGEEFDTLVASGTPDSGPLRTYDEGGGFSGSDTHYADGDYDGEMTHEAVVSSTMAEHYDLSVGDTLYVGGTISAAQRNEFEVVGISPTFEQFVGGQTVTIRLSELQTLTGTTYDDRATLITVALEDGADTDAVKAELEAAHPEFTVRTNEEQFRAVLERQVLVIAGGVSLVALAVLAGMVLSLNLFLSLIYQQREEFAIYRALGGSRSSTIAVAVIQATVIASAGCLLGLALSPPLALAIDHVAVTLTGFEGLVQIPTEGYLVGAGVAFGFGLVGTVGGVVRLSRSNLVAEILQ